MVAALDDFFHPLLVRTFVETESKLSSVERLSFFYRGVPTEPAITSTAPAHLREDWPTAGKVSVKNVRCSFIGDSTSIMAALLQMSASYSIGGKNVINNLSFEILGGEKVGVVGRTGAGKVSDFFNMLYIYPAVSCDISTLNSSSSVVVVADIGLVPHDPHHEWIDRDR